MSYELRPLGVHCNIACQYCYQNPQRDVGQLSSKYDMAKMKAALSTSKDPFVLFGGEPLLIPRHDLEELMAWGYEQYGENAIQTNGTLIEDWHIDLFKKYNVNVGISIDGPGELNDIRWAGSLGKTRASTAKIEVVINKLINQGLIPSLIITLHRNNATADKLPLMNEWLVELDQKGIKSVRLHILEVDDVKIQEKYALSDIENIEAFLNFASLEKKLVNIRLDVFKDMERLLLLQDDKSTCVWRACDPYATEAVMGVEGFGQKSNCGRTNKDGIDYLKSSTMSYERYIALYHTPQAYNGCKGCRFFTVCKGQCPGTAVDGDWRNRTEHCAVWKRLFEEIESYLVQKDVMPISLNPNLEHLEECLVESWTNGNNPSLKQQVNWMIQEAEQSE